VAEIIEKIEELLGFEIVEQSEHRCIIRNVANVLPEEFEPMLKRLFMIAMSFSADILAALKEDKPDSLSAWPKIEREINKLVNYCQRALNKGSFTISDMLRHHMLTERLEVIGDALSDYAEYIVSDRPKVDAGLLKFHEGINAYFRMIYGEYFKSQKSVAAARQRRFELYSEFGRLIHEKRICTASACYLKQMLEELHHIEIII
jgi:phosphate uptake regulator